MRGHIRGRLLPLRYTSLILVGLSTIRMTINVQIIKKRRANAESNPDYLKVAKYQSGSLSLAD